MAGPLAAAAGNYLTAAASRATNRYAAARAGSVARTGVDYLGGAKDFGAGFMSRATGMNASTGTPSMAGTAVELTGLSANGAIKNGAQYMTNQQASYAKGGGPAGPPAAAFL